MQLFMHIYGKIYIEMYSFVTKLSLKMAVMGRNMRKHYEITNIYSKIFAQIAGNYQVHRPCVTLSLIST
jgi:hypothetical protein